MSKTKSTVYYTPVAHRKNLSVLQGNSSMAIILQKDAITYT